MTEIARVRVALDGWTGGPGVNTLYFSPGTAGSWGPSNVDDMVDEVHGLFTALTPAICGGVTIQVEPDVAIIEPADGEIQSVITASATPDLITSSAGSTGVSRATQACVALKTGVYHNGRQLQGRLFIGPLSGGVILSNGKLSTDVQDDINDAFVAITSGLGTRLAVYSRFKGVPAAAGFYEDVTLAKVNETPAVLRSRRD